ACRTPPRWQRSPQARSIAVSSASYRPSSVAFSPLPQALPDLSPAPQMPWDTSPPQVPATLFSAPRNLLRYPLAGGKFGELSSLPPQVPATLFSAPRNL